VICLFAESFID